MAQTPILTQGKYVYNVGLIEQSPQWYCYQEGGVVLAQTKVCGTFGCNWHTRGDYSEAVQTTYWSRFAQQPCREGTNRYRTITRFNYRIFDVFNGLPALVPGPPISHTSSVQPEFTCK